MEWLKEKAINRITSGSQTKQFFSSDSTHLKNILIKNIFKLSLQRYSDKFTIHVENPLEKSQDDWIYNSLIDKEPNETFIWFYRFNLVEQETEVLSCV